MKKDSPSPSSLSNDDIDLFRQTITGAKVFKQDTHRFDTKPKVSQAKRFAQQKKQAQSEFYFLVRPHILSLQEVTLFLRH